MESQEMVVEGYKFNSFKDYKKALKEYENIQIIKNKLNPDNIDELKKIYNKMINKNYFSTPVGLGFLHEMRDYIIEKNSGKDLFVIPVPVNHTSKNVVADDKLKNKYDKLVEERAILLLAKKRLTIAVITLVIVVVGMIFIVITNDNLGYFNAEEKVLDKYSAWQERLQSWEDELIEREDALK